MPYGIRTAIGLVTSRDGVHWEMVNDGQPVLEVGPAGSADAKGLAHPFVMNVGEQFWMWYGASNSWPRQMRSDSLAKPQLSRLALRKTALPAVA